MTEEDQIRSKRPVKLCKQTVIKLRFKTIRSFNLDWALFISYDL